MAVVVKEGVPAAYERRIAAYKRKAAVRHLWSRTATAGTVGGMTSETAPPSPCGEAAAPFGQPAAPAQHFAMRFSSTPGGARLARRLAGQRLDAWGVPYDCAAHDALTLIVAELASNAVRHGRVSGRDFHLALTSDATTVRIEVTDFRGECVPVLTVPTDAHDPRDSGRGLLLVQHLAHRWDWHPRAGGPEKTVWAEYVLPTGG